LSSIPDKTATEILISCNHTCCKCRRKLVQIHHIEYLSDQGNNSFDNLIPLCPSCHVEVHVLQAAQGKPGVTVRSITPEQLHTYRDDWIEECKKSRTLVRSITFRRGEWHYYLNEKRINMLWAELGLQTSMKSKAQDAPSYNIGYSKKLQHIIDALDFVDLGLLLRDHANLTDDLIGLNVSFQGRFSGDIPDRAYYPQANWDGPLPTLVSTLTVPGSSQLVKIRMDIDPQFVTTSTAFAKMGRDPWLHLIGCVVDFKVEKNLVVIDVSPLHLIPSR
jgi:hypothetical protein